MPRRYELSGIAAAHTSADAPPQKWTRSDWSSLDESSVLWDSRRSARGLHDPGAHSRPLSDSAPPSPRLRAPGAARRGPGCPPDRRRAGDPRLPVVWPWGLYRPRYASYAPNSAGLGLADTRRPRLSIARGSHRRPPKAARPSPAPGLHARSPAKTRSSLDSLPSD